jgi:hypothetical protein
VRGFVIFICNTNIKSSSQLLFHKSFHSINFKPLYTFCLSFYCKKDLKLQTLYRLCVC